MLKPSVFVDLKKGVDKISRLVENKIELNMKFEIGIKEKKRRRTWFLDTKTHSLNKRNRFLLRVRKEIENDEYELTLKCRHPDRYMSASHDLSSPWKNVQFKFEEDISIPFISKFSHSASLQGTKMPVLKKIGDLLYLFPNLNLKDIFVTESLIKVNNFEPYEVTYKIGTLKLGQKKEIDVYINLWYLENSNKNINPLIVEMTFNYASKEESERGSARLEEFALGVVRKTNSFYGLIQDDEIADLHTTKTKTEFAYEFKNFDE